MSHLFTVTFGFNEHFQREDMKICIVESFGRVSKWDGTCMDPPSFVLPFLEPDLLIDTQKFRRQLEADNDRRLDNEGLKVCGPERGSYYDVGRLAQCSEKEFEAIELDYLGDERSSCGEGCHDCRWLSWRELLKMNAETWQSGEDDEDERVK